MKVLYYNEFKGLDGKMNRLEILSATSNAATEITTTGTPFVLQYQDVDKLTPIQGSQATMELVSKSNFQFRNLHTDDMQGFMVSFYREGKIFWHGWLDPELYNETLSSSAPYPVTFSASDFNVLERLRYRNDSLGKFDDIVPMITHIHRGLKMLALPFFKLYIGCSTTLSDDTLSALETVLHKTYVMSANFYDEDGEPMTCREVIESILQPYGLMMVQRDGNVYIYDYNTLAGGLPMKRYDFSSLVYEADESVNFNFGNVLVIGTRSAEGDYGYEEMINNVRLTSSLYGDSSMVDINMSEDTLKELIDSYTGRDFYLYNYDYCFGMENLSGKYSLYRRDEDIVGAFLPYSPDVSPITPVYRVKCPSYFIGVDSNGEEESLCSLNIRLQSYVNTRDNPFATDTGVKDNPNDGTLKLYCNLYTTDLDGKPLKYLKLIDRGDENDDSAGTGRPPAGDDSTPYGYLWNLAQDGQIEQGKCVLWISQEEAEDGNILDSWTGNANVMNPNYQHFNPSVSKIDVGTGLYVPWSAGYLVFEITNRSRIVNPRYDKGEGTDGLLSKDLVKGILINNISIKLYKGGEEASMDDYEFKSYINKKVASDMKDIELKCISANEEGVPLGKGNILRKNGDSYKLATSFTRSGQTDILERLLMCTIHSNFSQKNERFSVDLKIKGNPIMSHLSYTPVLQGEYLVQGCEMDFRAGKVRISAVGYSDDTAKLSDIPYD